MKAVEISKNLVEREAKYVAERLGVDLPDYLVRAFVVDELEQVRPKHDGFYDAGAKKIFLKRPDRYTLRHELTHWLGEAVLGIDSKSKEAEALARKIEGRPFWWLAYWLG